MRLAIFIDGGYLEKVLKDELSNIWIDFEKLPNYIHENVNTNLELLRTYYYHCLPYQSDPPTPDERVLFGRRQSFFNFLDRLPRFTVRMGRLEKRGLHKYEQKLVDVLLSIDLVRLSTVQQITHAALIAGDSDFCPAVEVAKDNGVSVRLFHGTTPHRQLWNLADERISMVKYGFFEDILLKK